MKTFKVKCTFIVDATFPDDWTDEQIRFDVLENSCPGTHAVGMAIRNAIKDADDAGICWACNMQGTNEIVG